MGEDNKRKELPEPEITVILNGFLERLGAGQLRIINDFELRLEQAAQRGTSAGMAEATSATAELLRYVRDGSLRESVVDPIRTQSASALTEMTKATTAETRAAIVDVRDEIEVVARTANPEFPNGLHTYIDITRSDDGRVHHQYIAADPVGGTPVTGEGGQLTYIEGHEKAANARVHSEPLHASPGMTLTQYGDKLVNGAKAYNAHPVRYDGLAEEGYNSNSFVSSLLIVKGGATASRDLEAMIAKGMHTPGPLRTDPNDHSITDTMAANFTERQSEHGKYSVPGLDHASIDPRRFSHDLTLAAEARPEGPQASNVTHSFSALSTLIAHNFGYAVQKAMSDHGWAKAPAADPTLAPDDRMHGVRIRTDGQEQVAGPGFRQAGTIESINERTNTITQRTDHGNVTYNLNELRLGMGNPADFASRLAVGKRVDIAITSSESVEVTPVVARQMERSHDLGHGR